MKCCTMLLCLTVCMSWPLPVLIMIFVLWTRYADTDHYKWWNPLRHIQYQQDFKPGAWLGHHNILRHLHNFQTPWQFCQIICLFTIIYRYSILHCFVLTWQKERRMFVLSPILLSIKICSTRVVPYYRAFEEKFWDVSKAHEATLSSRGLCKCQKAVVKTLELKYQQFPLYSLLFRGTYSWRAFLIVQCAPESQYYSIVLLHNSISLFWPDIR